uniref:C-type lectin domain-containing protein n=1 Tax=Parastrongyloides trichosuri TaxID=131310 RepID=A0A0N4ZDB1_PARTI
MLYEVKGWTSCWTSRVSINLKLSFYASKTIHANIYDLKIYEEETFLWYRGTYAIYSLATNMTTPTSWTIETSGPITVWAGFSLYGEVLYKTKCSNSNRGASFCEHRMHLRIPDHCLSCTGNPPKCNGYVDLDKKEIYY